MGRYRTGSLEARRAEAILVAVAVLMGCGIKDTVTSSLGITGELKLVNNTSSDAQVQRQPCGADQWQEWVVLGAGKSKSWTLEEQCYSLRAINGLGDTWYGTAVVQGGIRTTLWIAW